MNRKNFLVLMGALLTSSSTFGNKKKKNKKDSGKKKEDSNKITNASGYLALKGTVAQKVKNHDGAAKDYIFKSGGKEYIISRGLYDEIEEDVGRQVTLYCKVINGNKIIIINHVRLM